MIFSVFDKSVFLRKTFQFRNQQFEIINFQIVMKPRRPDSAKTHQTKRTLDSDNTKQDLAASKFSQTFSAGVNSIHQKPDQFKKYVSEKDKDPRFKHLVKPSILQVIDQKANKNEQSKPYKPFQKKKEKTIQSAQKKVEQPQQKEEKAEDLLSLSKGFAEKNKQKMNSLKMSIAQQKQAEEKNTQKTKPKINFAGFKVNRPGQKKEAKQESQSPQLAKRTSENKQKQEKTTNQSANRPNSKKGGKTEEQIKRAEELKNLERFVSAVEARNMQFFPPNYDRVISMTPHNLVDLQKIDLKNFLEQPTEDDYERMQFNIHLLDNQIQEQKVQQSIDLEAIIDSDTETEKQSNQSYLNSMTASELKKRNAFLTEVLAGKISKKEIDQLQEMNKSAMRIYKLQHQQKEEEDDQIYLTQINMVRRQSNRLIERNRLEAAGQLYRDCDYLSQQHKKRLQELLNGQIDQSPFQCNELQSLRRRGINQGIRMYRQMNGSQEIGDIFNQQTLPKDPLLKKQAQKKVLKEKINSVNQRLADVDKVVVTKAKIQSLIKSFEHTRHSASYQQLLQQNMRKFQAQYHHLQEAQRLIATLGDKENVEEVMREIQQQFGKLQRQIKVFQQLDQQQLRKLQKERLRRKLKQLQEIQNQNKDLEQEIVSMQRIKKQVEQKLKLYDQMQQVSFPSLVCEGYKAGQTLQDIDEVITKKMKIQHTQTFD